MLLLGHWVQNTGQKKINTWHDLQFYQDTRASLHILIYINISEILNLVFSNEDAKSIGNHMEMNKVSWKVR